MDTNRQLSIATSAGFNADYRCWVCGSVGGDNMKNQTASVYCCQCHCQTLYIENDEKIPEYCPLCGAEFGVENAYSNLITAFKQYREAIDRHGVEPGLENTASVLLHNLSNQIQKLLILTLDTKKEVI